MEASQRKYARKDSKDEMNGCIRVGCHRRLHIKVLTNTFVILVRFLPCTDGMARYKYWVRGLDSFVRFSIRALPPLHLHTSISMARDCPSVAELIAAVKSLTRATDGTFQTAWKDSFTDPSHCCEQGGYIYIGMSYFRVDCKSISAMYFSVIASSHLFFPCWPSNIGCR